VKIDLSHVKFRLSVNSEKSIQFSGAVSNNQMLFQPRIQQRFTVNFVNANNANPLSGVSFDAGWKTRITAKEFVRGTAR